MSKLKELCTRFFRSDRENNYPSREQIFCLEEALELSKSAEFNERSLSMLILRLSFYKDVTRATFFETECGEKLLKLLHEFVSKLQPESVATILKSLSHMGFCWEKDFSDLLRREFFKKIKDNAPSFKKEWLFSLFEAFGKFKINYHYLEEENIFIPLCRALQSKLIPPQETGYLFLSLASMGCNYENCPDQKMLPFICREALKNIESFGKDDIVRVLHGLDLLEAWKFNKVLREEYLDYLLYQLFKSTKEFNSRDIATVLEVLEVAQWRWIELADEYKECLQLAIDINVRKFNAKQAARFFFYFSRIVAGSWKRVSVDFQKSIIKLLGLSIESFNPHDLGLVFDALHFMGIKWTDTMLNKTNKLLYQRIGQVCHDSRDNFNDIDLSMILRALVKMNPSLDPRERQIICQALLSSINRFDKKDIKTEDLAEILLCLAKLRCQWSEVEAGDFLNKELQKVFHTRSPVHACSILWAALWFGEGALRVDVVEHCQKLCNEGLKRDDPDMRVSTSGLESKVCEVLKNLVDQEFKQNAWIEDCISVDILFDNNFIIEIQGTYHKGREGRDAFKGDLLSKLGYTVEYIYAADRKFTSQEDIRIMLIEILQKNGIPLKEKESYHTEKRRHSDDLASGFPALKRGTGNPYFFTSPEEVRTETATRYTKKP